MLHAASDAVLGTTELLENILYALPTIDLLHAEGVCRHWKITITESLTLQQALLLKPIAVKDTTDSPIKFRHTDRSEPPPKLAKPAFLWNPLLPHASYLLMVSDDSEAGAHLEDIVEVMTRPEASIGRMFLCQPAITCLQKRSGQPSDIRDVENWTITNPRGITMGDVYDRLWRVLETVEGSEKGVMSYILPVPGLVLDGWTELEGNDQLVEMKERLKVGK